MGGGCEHGSEHGRRLWHVPPPPSAIIQLIRGGGTPQKLMGGLSQNMGARGAWGELKMLSKNN